MQNKVELLLRGAIRENRGRGLPFYVALNQATKEELEKALLKLRGKFGRLMYSFQPQRVEAIQVRLAELGSPRDPTELKETI